LKTPTNTKLYEVLSILRSEKSVFFYLGKGRKPHKRTSWKLVSNPGYQTKKVAN